MPFILKYFKSKIPYIQVKKKKACTEVHSFFFSTNILGTILSTEDSDKQNNENLDC